MIHELFAAPGRPRAGGRGRRRGRRGRGLTYAELDGRADRLARRLAGPRGGRRGRRSASACERIAALVAGLLRRPQGGRGLPAARPGLPAGAPGVHARRLQGALGRRRGAQRGAAGDLPSAARPADAVRLVAARRGAGRDVAADGRRRATRPAATSRGEHGAPTYPSTPRARPAGPRGSSSPTGDRRRLVLATGAGSASAPASWSAQGALAFDASTCEIWGALLHGGPLVVVPRGHGPTPEAPAKTARATRR